MIRVVHWTQWLVSIRFSVLHCPKPTAVFTLHPPSGGLFCQLFQSGSFSVISFAGGGLYRFLFYFPSLSHSLLHYLASFWLFLVCSSFYPTLQHFWGHTACWINDLICIRDILPFFVAGFALPPPPFSYLPHPEWWTTQSLRVVLCSGVSFSVSHSIWLIVILRCVLNPGLNPS